MEQGCTGDQSASHHGSGLDEIALVIKLLEDAGIISCILGSKALFYYGAARISADWCVSVPNDRFSKATALFHGLRDIYEPAPKILPQIKSLLHTYPRFKPVGIGMCFYIMPAFEYFLDDLEENMLERSKNQLPYPKLEYFAQALLSTQRWPDLVHLVDGMDLTEEWGEENLYLGEPTDKETRYVADKNNQASLSRTCKAINYILTPILWREIELHHRGTHEGIDIEHEIEEAEVSNSTLWPSYIPDATADEQYPYEKLIYQSSQRKYAQPEVIPDPLQWRMHRRHGTRRFAPTPESRRTESACRGNNLQFGREELFVSVRNFTSRERWDSLAEHVRSLCMSIGVDDEVARVINSFPNLTSLELIGLPLANGHSPLAPDIYLPKLQKLKLRGYLSSAFVRMVCNNAQHIKHLDIGLLATAIDDQPYQHTLLSRLEIDDPTPLTAAQAQEFQQNGAEAVALAKKDDSGEATNECSDDEGPNGDEGVDDESRHLWPWALHAPIWLPRTLPSHFKSVTHLHLVKPYTGETSLGPLGTDGFRNIPHRYEQILCLEWAALLQGLAGTLKEVILEHRVVQNCGDTVTDGFRWPQEKGSNLRGEWHSHSFKSLRRLVIRGIQVKGISTRPDSAEVPGQNGVPNNDELLQKAYPDCDVEIFEDSYPIHIYAGFIHENWSVFRRHLSTQDQGDGLLYDGSFYNDYKKRFGPQWKIVDQ